MPGPQTPAGASQPVPPPVFNQPLIDKTGFGSPLFIDFLQKLWAGVFGGGGQAQIILLTLTQVIGIVQSTVDAKLAEQDNSSSLVARIAALEQLMGVLSPENLAPLPQVTRQSYPSAVPWTPVFAGSATPGVQTYGVQAGLYAEFGPLSIASFAITLTAYDVATAGNIIITGLPFMSNGQANSVSGVSLARWGNITLAAGASELTASLAPSAQQIDLLQSGSGIASSKLAAATGPSATSDIAGTVAYLR